VKVVVSCLWSSVFDAQQGELDMDDVSYRSTCVLLSWKLLKVTMHRWNHLTRHIRYLDYNHLLFLCRVVPTKETSSTSACILRTAVS